MELNWTTFAFQIVNFLILVWILKRFLYRPVLNVIERRREAVAKTLSDAQAMHEQALARQETYDQRLSAWDRERETAREQLHREIEEERRRLTRALADNLEQEREKARVLAQRDADEARRRVQESAMRMGGGFASRLLSRVAGPELEARLIALVEEDVAQLPADRAEALCQGFAEGEGVIEVASAFELSEDQRRQLQQALGVVLGGNVACQWRYRRDEQLLAGLRITIGPWVLRANLQDELQFFDDVMGGDG